MRHGLESLRSTLCRDPSLRRGSLNGKKPEKGGTPLINHAENRDKRDRAVNRAFVGSFHSFLVKRTARWEAIVFSRASRILPARNSSVPIGRKLRTYFRGCSIHRRFSPIDSRHRHATKVFREAGNFSTPAYKGFYTNAFPRNVILTGNSFIKRKTSFGVILIILLKPSDRIPFNCHRKVSKLIMYIICPFFTHAI